MGEQEDDLAADGRDMIMVEGRYQLTVTEIVIW